MKAITFDQFFEAIEFRGSFFIIVRVWWCILFIHKKNGIIRKFVSLTYKLGSNANPHSWKEKIKI